MSEFISAPSTLFCPGQVLQANLYIYLPQNKNILFFLRSGDPLTQEDCDKIVQLPKGTLLVLRSERQLLLAPVAAQTGAAPLGSEQAKVGASTLLGTLTATTPDSEEPSGEYARQCLMLVPKLVEEMMTKVKKTPSIQAYEKILQASRAKGEDAIMQHNEQVSALAILIYLSIGGESEEELGVVGTAGLLHDLGLRQIQQPVAVKHLRGVEELTSSEKIIYMAHVDHSLLEIKRSKTKVSAKVLKAVQNHHENFDGTGFKGVSGDEIDLPARIIRIADDIVVCVSHPKNSFGFKEALGYLTLKERHLPSPIYDPEIMDTLGRLE